jgi:DNA-binding NarL/FixJ family response regulator
VLSAPAAKEILATAEDSSEALKTRVGLTQRGESVLQALGRAKTQRDAARDLGIAERTRQQRVIAIKDKLRVDQPFRLGAWAHALGLVTLEEPWK